MKRKRRLFFQMLERRIALDASDYLDLSNVVVEPTYTTFDAPANRVTPRFT